MMDFLFRVAEVVFTFMPERSPILTKIKLQVGVLYH